MVRCFVGGDEQASLPSPRVGDEAEIEHLAQGLELLEHLSGEIEKNGERWQFLVAELEDVRISQGGFEDFLGVEILAQVHIENPECFGAHGFQEGLDRGSRNGASLGERSEANGVSARGEIPEVLLEADVVPSHLGEDFVGWLAVLKGHIHSPGGMGRVGLDMGVRKIFRSED